MSLPSPRRLSPIMFIRPCLAFLCFAATGYAATHEVPFDFLHNQILVRAAIGGKGPFDFIIDTGTRDSILDSELSGQLGQELGPPVSITGAGTGRSVGRRTVCHDFRIGDLPPTDLNAVVVDLAAISRSLGRPLHGVLGFGFLDSHVVQIDYFARRIRFLDSSPTRENRAVTFPMQFASGSVLPVIEDFYVNGTKLAVTLDTGSSMGLVLFPYAIKRLGLERLAGQGAPIQASGYLGAAQLTKGWVASTRIHDIDLGAIEVAFVKKGYGDSEISSRRAGNLGNALLQDFLLTLDYRDRKVTLERIEE